MTNPVQGYIGIASLLSPSDKNSHCTLRKPTEVGRFSLDGERKFHHDRHQMACLISPLSSQKARLNFDLSDGFETERFIKRDEDVRERLDHLLMWMQMNKSRFVKEGQKVSGASNQIIGDYPDFVVWRGHLTKFMCTPFENRDGWVMATQRHGNTIYISEIETDAAAHRRKNMTDRERQMTYWGVRFEGYMTGPFPKPGTEPQAQASYWETVTNTNEAFCSVLRSRLNGRHSLIYGAEVDCCHPVQVLNPPDCYVELKTSRMFTTARQEDNFYRFKALKWWAQSYLAGIPQITCGFRDDDGCVTHIENFQTQSLPDRAANLQNSWNPNTCLLFLDNFLEVIKRFYRRQSVCDMCIFTWDPGSREIKYEGATSDNDGFLPKWYIDKMQ